MLAILRLHTRYPNGSSLFSPGDDISPWLCSSSFPVSTLILHRRGSSISDVHCQWNSFTQGPCLYYIFSEKTIFSEFFFSSLCKYSGYLAMHYKYNYGICQQELYDCVQLAVCMFALGLHNPKCLYQTQYLSNDHQSQSIQRIQNPPNNWSHYLLAKNNAISKR